MNAITRINKAIGAVLGGIIGILVARGLIPADLAESAFVTNGIELAATFLGGFLAPKNKKADGTADEA